MIAITMLPAEDGDCLLVETEGAGRRHLIVIDGGRPQTARDFLSPALRGRTVDLMVLTHIDADHIEGLLELLGQDAQLAIGDVWFNGWRHLQEARDGQPPAEPEAGGVEVLNARQGRAFGALIEECGYRWNAEFKKRPVMTPDTGDLHRIALASGAELVLLGPTRAQLVALSKTWEKECAEYGLNPEATAGAVFIAPTLETIPARAKQLNVADRSVTNGSSIVFVLEHKQHRVLFGADATPNELESALRRYAPGTRRIFFDAVKVPHHGAGRNCTSRLIDLIESPRWLISTNGARHKHPDPEAIARILLSSIDGKRLFFNARSDYNRVWDDAQMQAAYKYATKFPAMENVGAVCRIGDGETD